MGTKFSLTSISGFNASPPSDDGSQTAANKVQWSTIKTKLADPVKNGHDTNMANLATTLDLSARAVTGGDSAAATDHWKTIQVNTASVTITLADAATMAAGYTVSVANQSSGNITVGLASAGDTIDGVTGTTNTIAAKECRTYLVNATSRGYLTHSAAPVSASDTVAGKIQIAVQADMETATSTTLAVTPGRQQYHPSAAKCWGQVDVSGGTPSLTVNYNITSITDTATGKLAVTIATDFSSANYVVTSTPQKSGAGNCWGVVIDSKAAGSFNLWNLIASNAGAAASIIDPDAWNFAAFGDQ